MTTTTTTTAVAAPAAARWPRVILGVGAVAAWLAAYRLNRALWDWAVFDAAGLDAGSRLGQSVHFFVFDTAKIALLLAGIVFVVALLRTYTSLERTRALLGGRRQGAGNLAAAGLGVITPFCSCSAVPAFIGFVAAGVPIGVTLSFLIASPMVNEVAIVLLYGLFGWRIAALYIAAGLVVAVVAGLALGRMRVERWVEPFVLDARIGGHTVTPGRGIAWTQRTAMARAEVASIFRRVWPYLLVGIGLGAVIHGWAPADLFERVAGNGNPLAVPLAVLLGVPLYSNAAGVLPLVEALHAKGMAMGTVLAFMMSVVALSLPELILLRRVLRPPLLALFVTVVATGIIAVGLLFNLVL